MQPGTAVLRRKHRLGQARTQLRKVFSQFRYCRRHVLRCTVPGRWLRRRLRRLRQQQSYRRFLRLQHPLRKRRNLLHTLGQFPAELRCPGLKPAHRNVANHNNWRQRVLWRLIQQRRRKAQRWQAQRQATRKSLRGRFNRQRNLPRKPRQVIRRRRTRRRRTLVTLDRRPQQTQPQSRFPKVPVSKTLQKEFSVVDKSVQAFKGFRKTKSSKKAVRSSFKGLQLIKRRRPLGKRRRLQTFRP